MKRAVICIAASLALVLGAASRAEAADLAFQVRMGGFFPDGDSNFWDETEARFTLDSSDFEDFVLGLTLLSALGNYLEVGFNVDFYETTVLSAEREFVDNFGNEILHDTHLETVPMTVDLRFLPGGRYRIRGPQGRQVLKPVFYIGGGLGLTYWEYEEVGDFVDDATLSIFFERFVDDGVAFEAHALAGLELPFGRSLALLFEGRYSWADDDLGGDFAGFGELDLSGPSVFVGGSFRF